MAARLVNIDYDTPLILPPNLRDWVPASHLAHFILDAVEEMDLGQVRVNDRGTGSPQYPPRMLLALLLYCYATGVFGSRRMEQATYDSVPVRMICGDTHPDHDTLCTFRRENQALVQETFVRVLELAQALKFLQVANYRGGRWHQGAGQRQQACCGELWTRGQNHRAIGFRGQSTAGEGPAGRQHSVSRGLNHSRGGAATARAQGQTGGGPSGD